MIAGRILVRLLVVALKVADVLSEITVHPRDTETVVGQMIFLNCSTSEPSKDIRWYRYTHAVDEMKYIYFLGQLVSNYTHRTRIEKNTNSGEFNLVILAVEASDAGKYVCQEGEHGNYSSAELIVLDVAPVCGSNITEDHIIGANSCGLEPDDLVQLFCHTTYHGNIPPIIKWEKDGKDLAIPQMNYSDHVISLLAINVSLNNDGLHFICKTTRSVVHQYNCTKSINVMCAFNNTQTVEKKEGEMATCLLNGTLPSRPTYKWKHDDNGREEIVANKSNIVLSRPGLYRCEADCMIREKCCLLIAGQVLVPVKVEVFDVGLTHVSVVAVLGILLVLLVVCGGAFLTCHLCQWMKLCRRNSGNDNRNKTTAETPEDEEPLLGCSNSRGSPHCLSVLQDILLRCYLPIRYALKSPIEPRVTMPPFPMENYVYSSAINYFYGHLHHVLPDFRQTLLKETLRNHQELVPKTVHKMVIIFPESCFCPPLITSPGKIEFTGKWVVVMLQRAGCQSRDHKVSVYKVTGSDGQEYYFACELCTSLLTMYETQQAGLFGTKKGTLSSECNTFISALREILGHPENSIRNDQCLLLPWCDPKTGKQNQQELYDLLLQELPKELERQKPISLDAKLNNHQPTTSEKIEVHGGNPGRNYDKCLSYPMERKSRGICLIVNFMCFDVGLQMRRGADKDYETLKELFTKLRFEVQEVVTYATPDSLNKKFEETRNSLENRNDDAFVCCLLSHGKLGKIHTSDGELVEILSLVDYFKDTNCPKLKGKPKMFFIQACQEGTQARGPEQPSTEVEEASALQVLEIGEDTNQEPSKLNPSNLKHEAVLVPSDPDFLMSYATLPGSVSYRNKNIGSYYIKALSECIGKDEDLETELKHVTRSVKEELAKKGNKTRFQLPFHLTSGMDRRIYL